MKKCPYCAEEIQEEANKCRFCGEWMKEGKMEKTSEMVTVNENIQSSSNSVVENNDKKCLLYSKGWSRSGFGLTLVAKLDHDILITENNFYLLKFRKPYAKRIIGFVIIIFGFILPGLLLIEYFDKKSRNKARASWLDLNNNLLSSKYTKHVVLQIPLSELKKCLSIEGKHISLKEKSLTISYSGQEVDLKYRKKEYERIIEFINK